MLNTFIGAVDSWTTVLNEPLEGGWPLRLKPEYGVRSETSARAVDASIASAELALSDVIPDWKTRVTTGYTARHRATELKDLAQEAVALIDRRTQTGTVHASLLDPAQLHHTVWEAAHTMWVDGHYRHAIADAVEAVNALVRSRTGYTISGAPLYEAAFNVSAPKDSNPRLHVTKDDGTDNFRNAQFGAGYLGRACVAALRNTTSHGVNTPLDAQTALEQLAMISVLTRWVETATVHRWEQTPAAE